VTRARTLPAAGNHTATVTEVATELQRAYAPLQPVRLLGVRMAAFEEGGEAADAPAAVSQLALPV
jgi:DNA polymerase-4